MIAYQDTVGSLAARSQAALKVLRQHGIDFCCGGGQPLGQACAEAGLDPEQLMAEIEAAESAVGTPEVSWAEQPLEALVHHILDDYHAPLRRDIPTLRALSTKVAQVHAADDGERLRSLASTFAALADDLESHMEKEEQVLFPWILAGDGAQAGAPIRVMQAEHQAAAGLLARIRELTDDFRVPAGACDGWKGLLQGLSDTDASLREHIHLENNILFPRALAG
ncbi:MAG: iron-sulfur cluster repair di-iron protein [Candidatus Latescibacterota bacterium]